MSDRRFDSTPPQKSTVKSHKRKTKSGKVLVREHLRKYYGTGDQWMGWTTSSNEKGIWIHDDKGGRLHGVTVEDSVSIVEGYVQDNMVHHGKANVKVYEADETHCTVRAVFKPKGYRYHPPRNHDTFDFDLDVRQEIQRNFGVHARTVSEEWTWEGYVVHVKFHNRW